MDTPMEPKEMTLQEIIKDIYQKIEHLQGVTGFILKETGLMDKLK